MFSTHRVNPDTPAILNGQIIAMTDEVEYLGVLVDYKLRFEEFVRSIVTKAEQCMHIVRNLTYLSTTPLATLLLKVLLSHCWPIVSQTFIPIFLLVIRNAIESSCQTCFRSWGH